jgi:sterol desaturase/sphingolipid hydroxylase (fatty acid hydroxylase superfamily)
MDPQLVSIAANLARMAFWLVLLAAIFVPIERLFPLKREKLFRRQIGVDAGYYFINGLIPGLVLGAPMALVVLLSHKFIPGSFREAIADSPFWARAAASMVIGETAYYWAHRLSHEIPLLWRFHAIHHSAEQIDFMVSTRAHPIDFIWSRLFMLTPLFALGLVNPMHFSDGLIPAVILTLGSFWGFFVHANVRWRLGPFEWLLATPGFHHWHHTLGMQRNCNYASIFPWLDRIFGTHYLPKEWPAQYGISEPTAPTLFGQLIQPFEHPQAAPLGVPVAPAPSEAIAGS